MKQLVEDIIGTCSSVHEHLIGSDVGEENFLEACSEAGVERCEECGWWSPDGEWSVLDDEIICNECQDNH